MSNKLIAFDVGASIGQSLERFVNFDEVYAFEPSPWSFEQLLTNKTKFPNTKFFQLGISNSCGNFLFNCHDAYNYSSLLEIDKHGDFTDQCKSIDPGFDNVLSRIYINVQRLDSFMLEHNIDHIDFLKIDTQGNDLNVVKSLGQNINSVSTIELEVQLKSLYKNASTKPEIIDFMNNKNFVLISEQNNNPCLQGYEEILTFQRR
jgi:FkbM family methyltransferase